MNDILLLIGRVLVALLFLMTAWTLAPNAGYLTSLNVPAPSIFTWVALAVEFVIVISLVLGWETRWGALLGVAYVIVATAFAHRYWEYTGPAAGIQYQNFTKNLAILGAFILLYAAGPGAYSVDGMRRRNHAAG
ncbi:MAG TPA: DoxX family protein [Stellaceae bacterium]|jgi:putative oxidoreductase|nr:DoxX family protein [Stellaceae bacterium]